MRLLIAICAALLLAPMVASAQQSDDSRFPLYRSPNEKQADYLRSQNRDQSFPPRTSNRDTNIFLNRPSWRHPYGYPPYRGPYRSYYYGPSYPYYGPVYTLPPVIRPWPVTPYPFRMP